MLPLHYKVLLSVLCTKHINECTKGNSCLFVLSTQFHYLRERSNFDDIKLGKTEHWGRIVDTSCFLHETSRDHI
jgi:hypothetical protein